MTIASRLASALDRRDEQPNIALAEEIAASDDTVAVGELVKILKSGTRALRHDAIKAVYETAERKPELVAPHAEKFIELLNTRDNRMVWGAMSALAAIAEDRAELLMTSIDTILEAADRSSVISRDKAMALLAKLNADPRYHEILMPVIFTRLMNAAVNQTPMYAELTAPSLQPKDFPRFREVVETRMAEILQPAKKARLAKLIRKLEKK